LRSAKSAPVISLLSAKTSSGKAGLRDTDGAYTPISEMSSEPLELLGVALPGSRR
jgi:hypothetical protein